MSLHFKPSQHCSRIIVHVTLIFCWYCACHTKEFILCIYRFLFSHIMSNHFFVCTPFSSFFFCSAKKSPFFIAWMLKLFRYAGHFVVPCSFSEEIGTSTYAEHIAN